MKVSIGSDHRGTKEREVVARAIKAGGHEVDDRGTNSTESCDYPDIAVDVAKQVASGKTQMGILICGTGIGMSIAANKVDGIRAALCKDLDTALLSRRHNDANVLCLAGTTVNEDGSAELISAWLEAEFEGGRHARRLEKVAKLEDCGKI